LFRAKGLAGMNFYNQPKPNFDKRLNSQFTFSFL
jgi:hypothetical protein